MLRLITTITKRSEEMGITVWRKLTPRKVGRETSRGKKTVGRKRIYL